MMNFGKIVPAFLKKLSSKKHESYLKLVSSFHISTLRQNIIQKSNENQKRAIYPLQHEDFFQVNTMVKLEELFKARCHYGHHNGLRCPWMNEFIYGTRINTDIIDLDKTVPMMKNALNFIGHVAFKNGVILLISRYAQHIPLIEKTANEIGEFSHCKPWKNGTFTDSTRRFGSVIRLPDLCIFFHTHDKLSETHGAVLEAAKMMIPTVAICDSDADPSQITYPIPANDDTFVSQILYTNLIKEVILKAKKKRQEFEEQGYEIKYE